MKKNILSAILAAFACCAFADGELVATGAGIESFYVGEIGNNAMTDMPVRVSRVFCPVQISVTNAYKSVIETESVFVPTNYVVVKTVTATNYVKTVSSNGVISITNRVVTASTTNRVNSIAGIDAAWVAIETNGMTQVVTNYVQTPAGGTLKLKTTLGDEWSLDLTGAGCAWTGTVDITKIVYPGTLKATASDAETATIRVKYLTFK